MRNFKRKTTGSLAAVLCMALMLGGCGSSAEEAEVSEEEASVTVSTQTVGTGTITLSNSFIGTISPEETVMVIPLAAGTVTETFFEVGDTVNAGDVLFKIDDEGAKLQLEQAQLNVQSTQQKADSTLTTQQDSSDLQLETSRINAQSGYEQAQIGYVQAKDAYNQANDMLDAAKKELAELEKQAAALKSAGNTVSANDIKDMSDTLQTARENVSKLSSSRDAAYKAYLSAKSSYGIAEQSMNIVEETAELTQGQVLEDTEEQLQTGLDLANIGVASAELALSYYTVTAPISGVIESKNVEVNGMAAQGNPAYTIVNNNTMTVTFQVSEAVRNTLSVGQNITLDRNGAIYQAAITEIGSSVNQQTGLFQIKACVQANGTQLPSGVSVKITADTYQATNAMLIPYDAVYYENEGAYVYTSVDGRAVKTPITTGIFDDNNIEVTSGLSLGDIVVTSWSPQLAEGVLLKEVKAETEKPAGDAEDAQAGVSGAGSDAWTEASGIKASGTEASGTEASGIKGSGIKASGIEAPGTGSETDVWEEVSEARPDARAEALRTGADVQEGASGAGADVQTEAPGAGEVMDIQTAGNGTN